MQGFPAQARAGLYWNCCRSETLTQHLRVRPAQLQKDPAEGKPLKLLFYREEALRLRKKRLAGDQPTPGPLNYSEALEMPYKSTRGSPPTSCWKAASAYLERPQTCQFRTLSHSRHNRHRQYDSVTPQPGTKNPCRAAIRTERHSVNSRALGLRFVHGATNRPGRLPQELRAGVREGVGTRLQREGQQLAGSAFLEKELKGTEGPSKLSRGDGRGYSMPRRGLERKMKMQLTHSQAARSSYWLGEQTEDAVLTRS